MESFPVQKQNNGIPRNPSYEKDILRILRHCRWILSSVGIWPILLKDTSLYLSKLAMGFWHVVVVVTMVPCSLHMKYELNDSLRQLQLAGLMVFCMLSMSKYWALVARRLIFIECIERVQDDWKQVDCAGDRKLMLKYGNMGRNLTLLCLVFMYTGGFMYHTVVQYMIGSYVDEQNRTIKPLVYPPYSGLYDSQRFPIYQLSCVLQCMCGYVIYSVAISGCGLVAIFVTHVCGQIDIMLSRLENLVDHKENTDPGMRLKEIVKHHIRTLRFSATIQTLLQEICFCEFAGSTFLICVLEYCTISGWDDSDPIALFTYTMLLISLTFNIFILCYIGELLVEKTSDVGISCFMIDWYHLPTKTIRCLILIIAMSGNPAKITAGQIADLNLSAFGNVLKTSLAYLSFLRTSVME